MDYKVRKLSVHDIPQITDLIDTCFHLKSKNKKKFIKWKFFTPEKSLVSYGAFSDEGTLVSFYSNKNMAVCYGDKIFESSVCLDMATHPEHRRKGLISLLAGKTYSEIKNNKYDFSFGFSNGSGVNVDKYATNYGYQILGQFRTYRKIILPNLRKSKFSVNEVEHINESESSTSEFYHIKLTENYINWRFSTNPAHKYHFYKVSLEGIAVGYCIVDIKDNKAGVLKVIESTPNSTEILIEAVIHYLGRRKVRVITMTVLPNKFWNNILKRHLFIPAIRKNKYYFTVYPHQFTDKSLLNKENWLLMGGDLI